MIETDIFKAKLEAMLHNVITELSTIGVYNQESDDWVAIPEQGDASSEADENTQADAVEGWNERRSTLSDLEREYRDIKRALLKIETGTYGVCEISGAPIEEKRLQARPEARTCVAHMDEEASLSL